LPILDRRWDWDYDRAGLDAGLDKAAALLERL
jgi:hypothetical protein